MVAPIALLTDFGLDDWYVAAMKGRILARLPEVRLIDISHAVPPGRIESAAHLLRCVMHAMPRETIFLCVVDPGVGTDRRALVGWIGDYGYAGPDNGLATPLLRAAGGRFHLRRIQSEVWREPRVSATFHGRDLFAPAAAMLAAGRPLEEAGDAVTDPVCLPVLEPHERPGALEARIVWIDRFGNLITNVEAQPWAERLLPGRFVVRAGSETIRALVPSFGFVAPGEMLAYWGSAGTLELAVNGGSAAARTGLRAGDAVRIDWTPSI